MPTTKYVKSISSRRARARVCRLNVAGRYDAALAEIADEKCIFLFPRNEEMAPGDIALHNDTVRNAISVRPVFAFSRLDREFAESLKAAKIAYVVIPGGQ